MAPEVFLCKSDIALLSFECFSMCFKWIFLFFDDRLFADAEAQEVR